jgi:hypothetical protein
MIDLTSYTAVESAISIKWIIPGFETAYLTDYSQSLSFNGDTYVNIGKLLSVSGSTSELKASPSELSVSLSGIPTGSIADILNYEIKGSEIFIYRAFLNPADHSILDLDPGAGVANVLLKFKGIVTNYDISDSVDTTNQTATSTITLTCNSIVEILSSKVSGRRTNPSDFPDTSDMSRVQALANSNFNFGADK